jgi:hypothetical protein
MRRHRQALVQPYVLGLRGPSSALIATALIGAGASAERDR